MIFKLLSLVLLSILLNGCVTSDPYYTIGEDGANEIRKLVAEISPNDAETDKVVAILVKYSKVRIKIEKTPKFSVDWYSVVDPEKVRTADISEEAKKILMSTQIDRYSDCFAVNERNFECSIFFGDSVKMVDGVLYKGQHRYQKHNSFRFSGLGG
jgi:exopolysaccharide biosynthesis protein